MIQGLSVEQIQTCRRCGAWRVIYPEGRPDIFKHGKLSLAMSPDIFTVGDTAWNRSELVKKLFELLEVE